MKEKMAIIDLGSNSVRMNVISINEAGGYHILDSAKEMVRLSEGSHDTGNLQEKAMDRTMKVLQYFKNLLEVHEVQEVYALCAAVLRKAHNKDLFLERVRREVGFEFKILSDKEEAYYDYLGIVNTMVCTDTLLIDIGGGSTELIWIENRLLKASASIPFGSVILTEMFADIAQKKKRVQKAMTFFEKELEKIPWLSEVKGYPIIGLGGTIRALGKVDRYMNNYPIRNLHNYHLTTGEVEFLVEKIFRKADGKEHELYGINKKRAEVITMGVIPILTLMHYVESKELRISGNGLRNGYFYEKYFEKHNAPVIVEDVLEHSYENLIRRFNTNVKHATHVQKLALNLFDALSNFHDFDDDDRKVLEIAALLHDIGVNIEYYDHHLHGMYILLYTRMNGLRIKEHLKVAFLVGSHREDGLERIIDDYKNIFSKKELKAIQNLSIFLQIAEQLDRSVTGIVERLNIEVIDEHIMIQLHAKSFPELEIEVARHFTDAFEKAFGYSYHLQYKPII